MNVRGDFLGPPHGTTTRALICKVKRSKTSADFEETKPEKYYAKTRHQLQYESCYHCDTAAFFSQSPIGRYQCQCQKCHREFARSGSLRRHLSSAVCKEDKIDMSDSDEEGVVSTKRSYEENGY